MNPLRHLAIHFSHGIDERMSNFNWIDPVVAIDKLVLSNPEPPSWHSRCHQCSLLTFQCICMRVASGYHLSICPSIKSNVIKTGSRWAGKCTEFSPECKIEKISNILYACGRTEIPDYISNILYLHTYTSKICMTRTDSAVSTIVCRLSTYNLHIDASNRRYKLSGIYI